MRVLWVASHFRGCPRSAGAVILVMRVVFHFPVLPAKACARHGFGDLPVIAIDALVS